MMDIEATTGMLAMAHSKFNQEESVSAELRHPQYGPQESTSHGNILTLGLSETGARLLRRSVFFGKVDSAHAVCLLRS